MTVRLEMGAGGQPMQDLLEQSIFKIFDSPLLAQGHDAAQFDLTGKVAFTTDSFVVKPLFFPGGDIGKLAVCGTLNDLAVSGAKPLYLSLALILEEGLPLEDLNRILTSVATTARAAGVQVVTGDTKVVEQGKGDGIFINTAGIGLQISLTQMLPTNLKAGQKILINGGIAEHGLAILAARENLDLGGEILSDCADLSGLTETLLQAGGVTLFKDPTRGGLAATLNELAQASGLGINLVEKSIPLDPRVEAGCGLLGIDPLQVANEGKLLVFAEADHAESLLEVMSRHPLGQGAAIIGEVTGGPSGKVHLTTRIGTSRVIDPPLGDQLPRIC
ncbi:MAG: hydrogenase expression/formation protein HypE [bacterium]|nr:hydrogenase expression/formation protein HypE [bacterium]